MFTPTKHIYKYRVKKKFGITGGPVFPRAVYYFAARFLSGPRFDYMPPINFTIAEMFPNATVPAASVTTYADLIREACANLDNVILLIIMFISSLYVVRVFMLRWAKWGLKDVLPLPFYELYAAGIDKLESFLDTGAGIGSMFLIWYFWQQRDVTTGYKVWIAALLLIIILSGVMNVIRRYKQKRK